MTGRWPSRTEWARRERDEREAQRVQIATLEGEGGPALPDHVLPRAPRPVEHIFLCPIDSLSYDNHYSAWSKASDWNEHMRQAGLS